MIEAWPFGMLADTAKKTQIRKEIAMLRTTLVSTVLFITLCGTGASAQQADVGQDLFEQYCATCHGLSGAGDGPLTVYLTEKVSDLTILAENNDGAFPMLKVIHIIDGRTGLRGHGGPMPTYGDIFEAEERSGMEGDYGPVLAARGRIMSVALYLEQLQK